MFGKDKKDKSAKSGDLGGGVINLIGVNTNIKGTIDTKSDIRMDGNLEGDLMTAAKLVLGQNGKITGNIQCEFADLSGTVEGNIKTNDTITLKSTAIVKGDIYTKHLIIEKGAVFNGKSIMTLPQSSGANATSKK